jgi:hypothetical protein
MASVEYGIKYYFNNPKIMYRAKGEALQFKSEMTAFTFYPSADWTKLAVDFKPLGISPYLAEAALEKRGIYAEMNDGRYLLFYLSPSVEGWQLNELKAALVWIISQKKLKNTYKDKMPLPSAERTYSFLYALKQRSEWVDLSQSVGKMCAENAGVTPPCLPVVIAGEIITQAAVEVLEGARQTFGILDGKIKVVKR